MGDQGAWLDFSSFSKYWKNIFNKFVYPFWNCNKNKFKKEGLTKKELKDIFKENFDNFWENSQGIKK